MMQEAAEKEKEADRKRAGELIKGFISALSSKPKGGGGQSKKLDQLLLNRKQKTS
jgi:hypothetical protein